MNNRKGKITSYQYDGLGRVIKEIADGERRSYSYYVNGLKASESNGIWTILYTEDGRGLLTKQTEIGAGSRIEKRYGYDGRGNRTSFALLKDISKNIAIVDDAAHVIIELGAGLLFAIVFVQAAGSMGDWQRA